jgi:hypothetical protein
MYFVDYTIPRVPECLSLRPNWLPAPSLPQASSPGRQHSLAGEWTEGTQFRRLERKPGTLFALCIKLFKNSYVSIIKGQVRALVFEACPAFVHKTERIQIFF